MSTIAELIDGQWQSPSPPKPRGLSAADAAENEAARLSLRQRAKQKLAACELAEKRYCELRTALEEIEAKKELLAAQHQQDILPLQTELDSIERRQVDLISSKLPVNPQQEERRGQLLDELRKFNVELSEAIESEDRLRRQLQAESQLLAPTIIDRPEHEAALIATSRADLRQNLAVAQNAAQWCEARLKNAQVKAAEFGNHWPAIVADAQQAVTVAKEREAAALAALLAE
jgi:hypothetical protein